MLYEAHCYDFQNKLNDENVTENGADLLQFNVIFGLTVPIVVVGDSKDHGVEKDGQYD